MKAYVFPGQGAQFTGMGKDFYEESTVANALFEQANDILGFRLSDVMFEGSADDLKQTKITQPAIFLHSMAKVAMLGEDFLPEGTAGHSLGEFSALVAVGAMSFEDGLKLVYARALAMQQACEKVPGTMAAVLGLEDEVVEEVCNSVTEGVVVAANYNTPGQLVISGSETGVAAASEILAAKGARRVLPLAVGGAFHSPLMQPAQDELEAAIMNTKFTTPKCPVYQNVDAMPHTDPAVIQQNLIRQLTSPVKWTQTILQMAKNGYTAFAEVGGKGTVIQGMIRKIDRSLSTEKA